MSKRKADGHVTVEEVDSLFRRPLALLQRPSVAPSPVLADAHRDDALPRTVVDDDFEGVAQTATGGVRRVRRLARTPADAPLNPPSPKESAPRPVDAAGNGDTLLLASRLEGSLLEASCLAAELQRRHRESLAEHQRLRGELRELVTVLMDQLGGSDAEIPPNTIRRPS